VSSASHQPRRRTRLAALLGVLALLAAPNASYAYDLVEQLEATATAKSTELLGLAGLLEYREGSAPSTQFQSASSLGYTGHQWDEEQQLVYAKARWYAPELGSFLSIDPALGDPGRPMSFAPFAYAMGNPLRYTDPTGLAPAVDDGLAPYYLPPPRPKGPTAQQQLRTIIWLRRAGYIEETRHGFTPVWHREIELEKFRNPDFVESNAESSARHKLSAEIGFSAKAGLTHEEYRWLRQVEKSEAFPMASEGRQLGLLEKGWIGSKILSKIYLSMIEPLLVTSGIGELSLSLRSMEGGLSLDALSAVELDAINLAARREATEGLSVNLLAKRASAEAGGTELVGREFLADSEVGGVIIDNSMLNAPGAAQIANRFVLPGGRAIPLVGQGARLGRAAVGRGNLQQVFTSLRGGATEARAVFNNLVGGGRATPLANGKGFQFVSGSQRIVFRPAGSVRLSGGAPKIEIFDSAAGFVEKITFVP